ncbi:jg11175 [Pararge aegeria aegeria]|uniref:Jg11175 protein n=1 Tax=Pararge aegeria aegeria TaxID=348720 RepID=A0A8S4RM66_9NEOP|nr:jg11175 [Pararge aegeria aegeria]
MEVSNEIKEDIRKTQSDLKNAIRIHQIWVARLQENENNIHVKNKVIEAEKDIISISHSQKLVVDRLRRELELYQQRLRLRNRQINVENDNRYVAQQLRDHQLQYCNRNRTASLLKPSVLNEIQIKTENISNETNNVSDSDNENKYNEKENSHNSERDDRDKYQRNFAQLPNIVHDSRNNFANALNKVKESFIGSKIHDVEWQEARSDSESSHDISPTPSPPPLPEPGEPITKEIFLRLIGLITHTQKDILERKRNERRKRSTTTNKNDFVYGNYEMLPKRKKYNQFPYLQSHSDPPQTRSAKLRKQQSQNNKSSREGSPSGSSSENKAGWSNAKPAWVTSLPAGLSVEPVYTPTKKVCHGCGRNDVPSLLVWCVSCSVWQHTGCGVDGRCAGCSGPLPDPAACASAPTHNLDLYRDKLAERKRLQERNIELCVELLSDQPQPATLAVKLVKATKNKTIHVVVNVGYNIKLLCCFVVDDKWK